MPLGLYYPVYEDHLSLNGLKRILCNGSMRENVVTALYSSQIVSHLKVIPKISNTCQYPLVNNKIIFCVKAWDPDEHKDENIKLDREKVNNSRHECIKLLKKEFNDLFFGGFIIDEFSKKKYPDSLLPSIDVSNKKNYMKILREHSICVATAGLFGSVGAKLAEYVAHSKAIVTENININVPGDFLEGSNYLTFTGPEDLANKIDFLISNLEYMREMQLQNYRYFNNYVRADSLVMNTLLHAF